jgi:hypothetical protein
MRTMGLGKIGCYSATEERDILTFIKTHGADIQNKILESGGIYDDENIILIFKWERGDVMTLDNVFMAHVREPFTGNRKVFIAMG